MTVTCQADGTMSSNPSATAQSAIWSAFNNSLVTIVARGRAGTLPRSCRFTDLVLGHVGGSEPGSAKQIARCRLGLRSGGHDGARVFPKHAQPRSDIGGMIVDMGRGEA